MLNNIIDHSPLLYLTQSFWRDEAFSTFMSQRPIPWIIQTLKLEPPLYYILLNLWMKVFGNSEIATRSLSLIFIAAATVIIIIWAEKLFKVKFLQIFLPVFFFLNPMIIYYAFEVRAYGLYILFSVISFYGYLNRKWVPFVIGTVGAFYSHTYFLFFFGLQFLHYVIFNRSKLFHGLRKFISDPMVKAMALSSLLILPWILKIITGVRHLNNTSWYYPAEPRLVRSVLGNLFLGYEGTPWYFWKHTSYLSLILAAIFIFSLKDKKNRFANTYLFMQIMIPSFFIVGISFIKPLFVNRYLLPVTVAQVLLIPIAFSQIKNALIRNGLLALSLTYILIFNYWYPPQHKKTDFRSTVAEVESVRNPDDLIYAADAVNYFETLYYAKDKQKVYLYNTDQTEFPEYVGGAAFSEDRFRYDLPIYPRKAFIINLDGTYTASYRLPSQIFPVIPKKVINEN